MAPKPSTLASATQFFQTPTFAVVGASSDPSKYGNKLLKWYQAQNLPVTPINPTSPSIKLSPSISLPAVPNVSALSTPTTTALSIVTPPKVTMSVLAEAQRVGVKAVWMQPGAFDEEVERVAREGFEVVVAGIEGGSVGEEGWCVLVDGEAALERAERGKGVGAGAGKL
ncbi:MAG: hypothetical protein M1814_000566 [Vezdaea aestivalis]|nr:MAG: hypothetical protein M1814_000566 [Vezdaea aestivalis]